jgi:hypothetical protein
MTAGVLNLETRAMCSGHVRAAWWLGCVGLAGRSGVWAGGLVVEEPDAGVHQGDVVLVACLLDFRRSC